MSAYWQARIIRTKSEISELQMQDVKIQDKITSTSDKISNYQEQCSAIWDNKQSMMSSALANYNNQLDQLFNQKISDIQNDQSLTDDQKNQQIATLRSQLEAKKQNKKLESEAYLKSYEQQFKAARDAEIEPLNRLETQLKLRQTTTQSQLKTRESQLSVFEKYNQSADKSIYGGGSSS